MNNRPCIISVGLPPDEDNTKMLSHLREMFGYVQIEKRAQGGAFEVLCAAPKNGLSYDEIFILLQKKYYDVGWVYADATPLAGK